MAHQHLSRNTKHLALQVVVIGHHATSHHGAAARYRRERLEQHAAGVTFGNRQRHPARGECLENRLHALQHTHQASRRASRRGQHTHHASDRRRQQIVRQRALDADAHDLANWQLVGLHQHQAVHLGRVAVRTPRVPG